MHIQATTYDVNPEVKSKTGRAGQHYVRVKQKKLWEGPNRIRVTTGRRLVSAELHRVSVSECAVMATPGRDAEMGALLPTLALRRQTGNELLQIQIEGFTNSE